MTYFKSKVILININIYRRLRIIVVLLAFILLRISLFAQHDVTLYYMDYVPQSHYTNPALVPKPKFHIALPVISHTNVKFYHDGFTFNDIINKRPDDSLTITLDNAIEQMADVNHVSFENNIDLISVSFKIDDIFFYLNVTEKIFFKFGYPKDLLSFVWKGNKQFLGSKADFGGLAIDFSHYREYAIGATKPLIDDKLIVGGKFKLLFGKSNLNTVRSDISLYTDSTKAYALTAYSDFLLNTSGQMFYDSFNFDTDDFDVLDYFLTSQNLGMAIDLGIHYKMNKLGISASLIDFGYIKWNTYKKGYYTEKAEFTFEGIEFNNFFSQEDGDVELDSVDQFEGFLDSVSSTFEVQEKIGSYSSRLNTKIYLGANYNVPDNDKLIRRVKGLVAHG